MPRTAGTIFKKFIVSMKLIPKSGFMSQRNHGRMAEDPPYISFWLPSK